jgi:toxin ParE1/3/4
VRERSRIVLSPDAQRDIREALKWSRERFGERAAVRYRDLLKQALRDIAVEPQRPGSRDRPDLAQGVRTYHLYFSCTSAVAAPEAPQAALRNRDIF